MQPSARIVPRLASGPISSKRRVRSALFVFLAASTIAAGPGWAATLEPKLVRTAIPLAPTERQLETLPVFAAEWHLPPPVAGALAQVLATEQFSAELSSALQTRLSVSADGSGLIRPDAALLDRFRPEERSRWLRILASHSANVTYRWPIAVRESVLAELEAEPALREAAGRLRRWSFSHAERFVSGDLCGLEDAFPSAEARQSFYQRVLGSSVWMARLSDEQLDPSALDAVVGYWELNGRYRAIRPLLATLMAIDGPNRIDVAHLLPRQPRALLNTYTADFRHEEDLAAETGILAARFLTRALEERIDLQEGFSVWLRRECEPIEEAPQFGDIAVFGDIARTRWPFAAVYLADGIVFTRRPTLHGPWGLYAADDLALLNPRLSSQTVRYYRRRAALTEPADPPFRRGELPPAWRERLKLRPLAAGPWGRLWCYDLLLTPPGTMLEQLPEPSGIPEWSFAEIAPAELVAAIDGIALEEPTKAALHDLFVGAQTDAAGVVTVHPSLELVLATPREVREQIFAHLVPGNAITDYTQHLRLPSPATTLDWFPAAVLPLPQRESVARLVYRQGGSLVLSDYGALFRVFDDRRDRLTALRALFRTPALCVLLERPDTASVSALAEYWQLDQQKDVRQLLESFAASDMQYLDILHLLPVAPRQLLNFYAAPIADTGNVSCYWTALNFSAATADARLLVTPNQAGPQAELAWQELMEHYEPIERPERFGDVIAYREHGPDGALTHVCTFIADDVVYTKNGFSFADPWCLTHLASVDAVFLQPDKVERLFFRRRAPSP